MNRISVLKTVFSVVSIIYIMFTLFQKFFVDNVFTHIYLLWVNPVYAFLDYLMQNQYLIVGLLTLLVAVIVIIVVLLFKQLEKVDKNG